MLLFAPGPSRPAGTNEKLGSRLSGRLNLVDLAGSERLSRSEATGDRLRETQAINKSLSCLADVFSAIARKMGHVRGSHHHHRRRRRTADATLPCTSQIPFRNSKLTHLLQPCFSGDGKTLMMVNLSPTFGSHHETLCSLRFAERVNQCELGRPERRIEQLQRDSGSGASAAAPAAAGASAGASGAGSAEAPVKRSRPGTAPAGGAASGAASTRASKLRRPAEGRARKGAGLS